MIGSTASSDESGLTARVSIFSDLSRLGNRIDQSHGAHMLLLSV